MVLLCINTKIGLEITSKVDYFLIKMLIVGTVFENSAIITLKYYMTSSIFSIPMKLLKKVKAGLLKMISLIFNIPVKLAKMVKSAFLKVSSTIFNILKKIASNVKAAFIKLKSRTKNPVQSNVLTLKGLFFATIVALAVFAAYYFIQPFEVANYNSSNKSMLIGISALAAFVGMLISDFGLPSIFKNYFAKEKWTVAKQTALYILRFFFVGLCVMVLGNQTGLTKFDLPLILLQFTAVGAVIGFIGSLIKEQTLRKRYQSRVEEINERLQNFIPTEDKSSPFSVIMFSGANDKISVVPNQLISVKTNKYNTEFSYQNLFGTVNKGLDIRSKDVINEMSKHKQFIQLAKGHFVNAHALYKTSANGSGYEAHIAKLTAPLKVSRNFQTVIERL